MISISIFFKILKSNSFLIYLSKASQNCPKFLSYLYDCHSLLEQEICFQSDKFLWSTGSSWSMNVLQERALDGRGYSDAKNLKILFGFKNVKNFVMK